MKTHIQCYSTCQKNAHAKFELKFFWFGFVFAWGDVEDFYFQIGGE